MLHLVFPAVDPIAASLGPYQFGDMTIGPLAVRWYALAYLVGFIVGWRYCLWLARENPKGISPVMFDEFLTWAVIGTILGGRLGYIFFYQPDYYVSHPIEILQVWHGGMSFHGGMLGVISAAWIFTRIKTTRFFGFTDVLACATPVGLGLGRIANFINGELYGRVATDVPWGIVFPRGGDLPRHPSQIYEALLEGLALFILMFALSRAEKIRAREGFLSGSFLFLYGLFRFSIEFLREPDVQLGFIMQDVTMGQLLCMPMMLFGIYLVLRSERRVKPRLA
jgi:phosphatidylglycerol:prolipoprotein diacylglycerol transferase